MTICLTDEKKDKIISLTKNVLASETVQIRSVAQVIDHMVSNFPAVEYGPLYYQKIDKDYMAISCEVKDELNW